MTRKAEQAGGKKRDSVAMVMITCYIIYLLVAVLAITATVVIQLTYKQVPNTERYFKPRHERLSLPSQRGAILDVHGRLLAKSIPMYRIAMDCTVRKKEFQRDRRRQDGAAAERRTAKVRENRREGGKTGGVGEKRKQGRQTEETWRQEARELSEGLVKILPEMKMTAGEFYQQIIRNREQDRRYVQIGGLVDHATMKRIRALPLFRRGANKGGLIVEKIEGRRRYPYGSLARRTIGYVRERGAEEDTQNGTTDAAADNAGRGAGSNAGRGAGSNVGRGAGSDTAKGAANEAGNVSANGAGSRKSNDNGAGNGSRSRARATRIRSAGIGIEGKFDEVLRGQNGQEWLKVTDNYGRIRDSDSTWTRPKDGNDVRTTIDIDIQDLADRALREQIQDDPRVEGGCAIVMDVETGAVRAMVNLLRDAAGGLSESLNLAVSRSGEPGSVFKTVCLMGLLEDGEIHSLQETVPTNHGEMRNFERDTHIRDYERKTGRREMTVLHGFEISSNYIFRKLITDHYGKTPQRFIDRLSLFDFGNDFDFDIDGLARPVLPDMHSGYWSATDFAQLAIGYRVQVTPLHTLTFYNAIANDGIMMRPRLVECIEKDGRVIKSFPPKQLKDRVCSKATADTLKKALRQVVEEGTGRKMLAKAVCEVAGKTGTSRIAHGPKGYQDPSGRIRYQATFVGFFPAERPEFSAIVVLYSKPIRENFYGGGLPAKAFRTLADELYALDPEHGSRLDRKGPMPKPSSKIRKK